MSKIVDALELALRLSAQTNDEFTAHDRALIESALAEARAAVSAEPVAWLIDCDGDSHIIRHSENFPGAFAGDEFKKTPLYTTPPPVSVGAEPMDDTSLRALISEAGNRAHNLSCEYQNNEVLAYRLGNLAVYLWDLAGKASAAPPPGGAEPVVWSEADIASMRVAFSKRFNDPIPRTETLMGVAAVGYRKALGLDPVLNLSAPPPVEASQQQADEVSEEYTAGYLAGWRSAKRGDSVPPKQRGQAGRGGVG